MKFVIRNQKLRILDFDIEVRPLSWFGGDFVSHEVTAIGAQFIGSKQHYCFLLGDLESDEVLEGFRELYDQADIVTGHYIRGADLPWMNSNRVELGLAPLGPKLTQDTKFDLVKWSGVSKSQESIGAMLGLPQPKVHMTQTDWRIANRLTPDGLERTRRRVLGDVKQHIAMRQKLIELGYLGPPRLWVPQGSGTGRYQP